ncbi:MAG: sulfatase [Thermodesulfobacteriota bacterium]|jgi:arylsulfatase A-like enzyme|nr:MAG: sulfatase [Thermodesulfobacteriota bacterium]
MSSFSNVFLVVIDALRFDRLGCYGYQRETSPAIDKIAAEGITFERAMSQSSWTKSAVASLLTSTYPEIHGVKSIEDRLSADEIFLPAILKKFGYVTGCVQTNPFLSSKSGFNQDFDFYLELFDNAPGVYKPRINDAVNAVFDWLDQFITHPFFLYLHVLDTHNPYAPPKEFNPFGNAEQDLFDGEVKFVDYYIGLIREYLAVKGLTEKTLFIITSDHGEEFGDHGHRYHAKHLYQEVLHVPLIISSPALIPSGISIPSQVRSIDLVPTILEVLGIPPLASHQGESLIPLLKLALAPDRPVLSQIGGDHPSGGKSELISFNTGDYKIIWNKQTDAKELYHLATDPHEKNNIADEKKEACDDLQTRMKKIIQPPEEAPFHYKPSPAKVCVDDDLLNRLRGLGYID